MSSRNVSVLVRSVGAFSLVFALAACGGEDNTPNNNPCFDPLATGCNQGGGGGGGGSGGEGGGAAVQPNTFFEGTYKVDSIDYAWTFNQDFTNAAKMAVAYDWAGVEAAVAPSTLIGQKLDALEIEFSVGAEAKVRSPKALIAKGLEMGKSSGGDETKNAIAKQYVDKSLIVLTELYVMHEIAEALEATTAQDAAVEIDAAAIILAGLESRMISRSTTEVPALWKTGSTLITQDKLAMRTGELLFAARTKIAEGAVDAPAALVKANVYATKYFYASVMNYGYKVEVAVAGGSNSEISQTEGAVFSEGLSTGFFGSNDAAAATMRGIWIGPAEGVTTAGVRAACIGVYSTLTANAATYIAMPQPEAKEMLESAGTIAGSVELLTEALEASGADVAALQGKAAELINLAAAKDAVGASTLAAEISTAVTASVK